MTDSPELGPPPIAHFDESEPVKVDSRLTRTRDSDEETLSAKILSTSSETRKKRRESFQQRESRAEGDNEQGKTHTRTEDPRTSNLARSGAKRKMNVRDDEDGQINHSQKQDSKSSLKTAGQDSARSKTSSRSTADGKSHHGSKSIRVEGTTTRPGDKQLHPPAPAVRKALAPKSGNIDPQSPVKIAKAGSKQDAVRGQNESEKANGRRNQGGKQTIANTTLKGSKMANTTEQQAASSLLPPKTPVIDGLDLFSPTVSDPSEPRPERGDTPPPPDLGSEPRTGSFGRSSRRSRGSVSYAEPNLRDKMRRPTKEFVDAVAARNRVRQTFSIKRDGSVSSLEAELDRLRIEQEVEDELQPTWQTKPIQECKGQQERQRAETSSPLGNKANLAAATLPASVVTDRRRRASSVSRKDEDVEKIPSGSATAIAALRSSEQGYATGENHAKLDEVGANPAHRESLERTSIFDFHCSSP